MTQGQDPRFQTLDQFPLVEIVELLNRGFEGYLVPMRFSSETLATRIRRDHVDLGLSHALVDAGGARLGVVLVARRGRTARIAALGIAPEARGRGLGRQAVQRAASEARQRGDERLLLEVISSNTAACGLYRATGFTTLRTLVGYELEPAPDAAAATTIVERSPDEVLGSLLAAYPASASWMTAPVSFAGATSPAMAFVGEGGAVALVEQARDAMRLMALAVPPERRRRGLGRALMQALFLRFPQSRWSVPPIVPEELAAPFFAACGWRRSELTQFEMELRPLG